MNRFSTLNLLFLLIVPVVVSGGISPSQAAPPAVERKDSEGEENASEQKSDNQHARLEALRQLVDALNADAETGADGSSKIVKQFAEKLNKERDSELTGTISYVHPEREFTTARKGAPGTEAWATFKFQFQGLKESEYVECLFIAFEVSPEGNRYHTKSMGGCVTFGSYNAGMEFDRCTDIAGTYEIYGVLLGRVRPGDGKYRYLDSMHVRYTVREAEEKKPEEMP